MLGPSGGLGLATDHQFLERPPWELLPRQLKSMVQLAMRPVNGSGPLWDLSHFQENCNTLVDKLVIPFPIGLERGMGVGALASLCCACSQASLSGRGGSHC